MGRFLAESPNVITGGFRLEECVINQPSNACHSMDRGGLAGNAVSGCPRRHARYARGIQTRYTSERFQGLVLATAARHDPIIACGRASSMRWRERKDADVLEVAVSLRIVQAVPDDEFVRDLEPNVIRFHVS